MDESGPTVDIDLDALCANFRTLRAAAPSAECAPVVKCNGYGLGAGALARALAEREGARSFFVTYAQEGMRLREALAAIGGAAVIYVFNGPQEATLDVFRSARLTPVLNSIEQARLWARSSSAEAALHVDTGMNRFGAPRSELAEIARIKGLAVSLVMSHLACASEAGNPMNSRQRALFLEAAASFPNARKSLSASGGALAGPEFHFDLIRPGVALYGASPLDRPDKRLQPVATLTAPVVQLREAGKGDACGYGATRTFDGPVRLATIALGYGDGFLRGASGRSAAWLGGALCPVAGRVSMDLVVLDVSKTPQPVAIGDRAEFFGRRRPIEDAAAAAGTIPYELLTALGARVRRRYLSAGGE
jgi:alanine racemase